VFLLNDEGQFKMEVRRFARLEVSLYIQKVKVKDCVFLCGFEVRLVSRVCDAKSVTLKNKKGGNLRDRKSPRLKLVKEKMALSS